eukprot:1157779-Pelagomonas_calceolata.AAC.23
MRAAARFREQQQRGRVRRRQVQQELALDREEHAGIITSDPPSSLTGEHQRRGCVFTRRWHVQQEQEKELALDRKEHAGIITFNYPVRFNIGAAHEGGTCSKSRSRSWLWTERSMLASSHLITLFRKNRGAAAAAVELGGKIACARGARVLEQRGA